MREFFSKRNIFSSFVSITLSVAVVTSVAFAASTISTNISTDGTLAVTGASTFTGVGTFNGQLQASSTALFGAAVTAYAGLTVGSATVANSLDGTILFKAQTSDPTGVTQGTVYYNSTSKVLRLFDGTNWFTTGTTTAGLLLSNNRIQLDDLTVRFLTIGTTTQQGTGQGMVTLEATTTTAIPLSLVAFTSQTGHIFDVLNSAGTKLWYLNSGGGAFASSTSQVTGTMTTYGNVVLGDAGNDVITITGNASTTNALTVGGNLYVGGRATTTASTGDFVTLGNATTSALYVTGGLTVNGMATTSSTGNISALGTLSVGNATTTSLFAGGNFNVNGYATTTSAGAISTLSTLSTANATTTALYAGGGFTVNGMATTSSTGNFGAMGKIGAGTTTPTTLELSADGAATTTVAAFSSATLKGGCIQLEGPDDTLYRMYVNITGTATTTGGVAVFNAVWQAGSCK